MQSRVIIYLYIRFSNNQPITQNGRTLREDYLKDAQKVITDPNILINVVSKRAKQLRFGNKALVESLERLSPEDTALREIIEGKIDYVLHEDEEEQS